MAAAMTFDPTTLNLPSLEQKYNLPPGLLSAVMKTESNGNPEAVSPAGAQGLFQFMPATAQQYGIDPSDPQQSASGAARYYSDLLKQNNGDLDKALASYNFGPGNVAAGKPLPEETQNYIAKVKSLLPQQVADSGQISTDAHVDTGLPPGFVLDSSKQPGGLPEGFVLDNTKETAKPKGSDSFLGEMGDNFKNAIQSGKDLLSGNYEDIGRTEDTPKTQALADKLFPDGSDGSFMGALRNVGNTNPSDWSGALLEKFGATPEGKAVSVLGGINPVWNAAGTAINRYVNPAIAKTTGIAPDNLALMELAGSTLGLKKAGEVSDPTVNLVKKGVNSLQADSKVPTAADIRANASQVYAQAEQQGGVLKPAITDNWINAATNILPQTSAGKLVLGESPTSALVDRLQGLRGQPLSLQAAQEIDAALGDHMNSQVNPRTGKLNAEGNKLFQIQQSLRDTIEKSAPTDILGGKDGFDSWKQGRSLWAQSARMNEIERIIGRAEDADNPTTVLKNGFRALKNNPTRLRGFSAEEQAAIKRAAKTGLVGGALKFGGSRIISSLTGAIGGFGGGGPLGAAAGAAAGAAVGTPLRAAASALQRGRAQNVLRTIAQPAGSNGSALMALTKGGASALPNTSGNAAFGGALQQYQQSNQPTRIGLTKIPARNP